MTRRSPWQPPAWHQQPAGRLSFLHELRGCGVAARQSRPDRKYRGGFQIEFEIKPPGLPMRRVRVVFRGADEVPHVHADGPNESPHRYNDDAFCMWYPYDPPEAKWIRRDGARMLLAQISAHLIREEWWRRTGEWVGDEFPHESEAEEPHNGGSQSA